jgi:hypothetical protein
VAAGRRDRAEKREEREAKDEREAGKGVAMGLEVIKVDL